MATREFPRPLTLVRLVVGLYLFGLGIAFQVQAALGLAPWDVFGQGLANITGLSFGLATVLASAIILLLWIPLKQKPGIGTVFNALLIGPFIDLSLRFVPSAATWGLAGQIGWYVLGMAIIALGTGIYIGARLGPGPRDGLMTGSVARFKKPVWMVRTALEGAATLIGLALGGPVGLGTLLFVVGIGPMVQISMRAFKLVGKKGT
ncbi:MAG: YczE/YyaS/YitT family protein [Microbacteriaceae bacterium]